MSPFQTYQTRLVGSRWLSEVTRHLEFEIVGAQRFGFVPGQWLSFQQVKPDGEELTRAYSIASPPRDDSRFALCLNRVQDGFMSNYLCDMREDDETRCQGPFGNFILRPPMRDTILIATGTGIAPFRAMLHWLFADAPHHQGRQFWLLFGSRYEKDIYYDSEFQDLEHRHANFHYLPTLSRGGSGWKGLRGYVQDHIAAIVQGRTDMQAYICGLEKMVSANRELLKTLGWDAKAVHYEKYA